MAKDESLAPRTREKFSEIFIGVTIVSELALEMAGGSAMDVLRERMTRKLEALGKWPREEGTMASWAENSMGEIQVQRSLLETHDNFFEEKLAGLKSEMQSLMEDFKGTLQSYGGGPYNA